MRAGRIAILCSVTACGALHAQVTVIDRADYADRLHAMWLGQCIANWTGLISEGRRVEPPFLTDADWGTTPAGFSAPLQFVLWQDPWLADDDTDVEYVYLHLMSQASNPWLTPEVIRAGWRLHMDPGFIWVSNYRAWELMGAGVRPPGTSFEGANHFCYAIDAQLTTEFFGAIAPCMPAQALSLAELPIRATAFGHAAHAAQFYAILYSLALRADPALSGRDRAIWLVTQARQWIPPTSKARAAIDLVLNDFLANPDVNNWERTRDLICQHFQQNAAANGWAFRGWTESTVNFACGVMALLYGQCDYRRTVQIGTLSGWDSDNGTATMGGLLGLMMGTDELRAQFPGWNLSDRFDIERTRNNLPDHLPGDPAAQDTLTLMAQRMLPLIDDAVLAASGTIVNNQWRIPTPLHHKIPQLVPGWRDHLRSANNRVRLTGGQVSASAHPTPPQGPPGQTGSPDPAFLANGYELNFSGREFFGGDRFAFSTAGASPSPGQGVQFTVTYSTPVMLHTVRFIEGDHFPTGGWLQTLSLQVRTGGQWIAVQAAQSEALDSNRPFQVIDLTLPAAVLVDGIRVSGPPGGSGAFATCLELDALAPPPPQPLLSVGHRQP
jgi:hypothetical protein